MGLGVFFFQDPRLGLAMIVLGELAAFICVWVDERRQLQYWERKYIMRRIGA